MAYIKPQSPLRQGTDYVYPVTTYDQIITPTGERWNGTIIRATDTAPEDAEIWIDTSEDNSTEIMPKDALKYISFSIATGDWSGTSTFSYAISKAAITENMCMLTLNISEASQQNLSAAINWSTSNGVLTFTTASKPSGTVTGYCVLAEVTVL